MGYGVWGKTRYSGVRERKKRNAPNHMEGIQVYAGTCNVSLIFLFSSLSFLLFIFIIVFSGCSFFTLSFFITHVGKRRFLRDMMRWARIYHGKMISVF